MPNIFLYIGLFLIIFVVLYLIQIGTYTGEAASITLLIYIMQRLDEHGRDIEGINLKLATLIKDVA
jgi:hypothetical protein